MHDHRTKSTFFFGIKDMILATLSSVKKQYRFPEAHQFFSPS